MFAVNVRGTFLCAQAAAAAMAGRGGSIVNIASQTALNGSHGFVHYVASKGAVVSMTKALANEFGPQGVRVNCVAPGFTTTPGTEVLGTYDPSRTPLGRVMRTRTIWWARSAGCSRTTRRSCPARPYWSTVGGCQLTGTD